MYGIYTFPGPYKTNRKICKKGMLYTFNWISGATNAEVAEETFLIEE